MGSLPPSMPVPEACPECGGEWSGWVTGPTDGAFNVGCVNGHGHRVEVDAELAMRIELDLRGWLLASGEDLGDDGPRSP